MAPASGNRSRQREREDREKGSRSVISVEESMSRKFRQNDMRSKIIHSHHTQHDLEDRDHLREDIERRAQKAILGENYAQKKLYSTENDMEIKNSEGRNSEHALHESQRDLESQRRQLQQASQWADHSHRERISLCPELERKNRLHQESYARSCQEIEEWKRRCYKEENEVIQQTFDEYSTQHGREWRTVSLLRDQVGNLQQQLDFLKDEKEFHDPDPSSSSSRSHVPHQPLVTSSTRRKPSHESGVLRNAREDMSFPGGVFACQPARRQNLDEIRNNSTKLATSSRMNRRDGIETSESGEPLQAIPMPCFQGRARVESRDSGDCPMSVTKNHAARIGKFSHSGMTNYPGFSTPEMNFGKFLDHTEFQSWRVNFRTDVCSRAKNPSLASDQRNRNSQIN